jgi:hypothetical protein
MFIETTSSGFRSENLRVAVIKRSVQITQKITEHKFKCKLINGLIISVTKDTIYFFYSGSVLYLRRVGRVGHGSNILLYVLNNKAGV